MALELARMALWLEAYTPDAPLGFIDHHFRLGNALLGVMDPKTLLDGVPDEAYKELTGDSAALCRDLKRRNKREREGLLTMRAAASFSHSLQAMELTATAAPLQQLDALPDATLADIAAKRQAYAALQEGAGQDGLTLAMHLYCAAFLLPKHGTETSTTVPTTQDVMNALLGQPVAPLKREAAQQLAANTPLLHWRLGFAQVFARGGFTIVLGNPPWDMLQLDPEEYFSSRDPRVANARNMAERMSLIEGELRLDSPHVYREFVEARDLVHRAQAFAHGSGRFPLSSFGRINLAPMFVELALQVIATNGRAGLVVPSGIATDSFNQYLFAHISNGRLVQLVDFENRERIFPAVDSRLKFCLLTLGASDEARFAFFLTNTEQLKDPRRSFTLSAADIALLNPNTRTCPVFRSQKDAEITKRIYRRVSVLWDDAKPDGNPWNVQFMLMFMMNTNSDLFRDSIRRRELDDPIPLYEGKMVHHFDHRWATYVGEGDDSRDMTDGEKADPTRAVQPRYWLERRELDARLAETATTRGWLLGFRDITNATNERTVIAHVIPRSGVGNQFPLLFSSETPGRIAALIGSLSSLALDFHARHKVGGTHLNFYLAKQLAVLPPSAYTDADLLAIVPRVLELTYTAHDLQPFYADLVAENPAWDPRNGTDRGQPWLWNSERRALLRAELDAIYARLYGLTRDELRYILDPADVMGADYPSETFRVLKGKEIRLYGEYRTQRLVLEAWDVMSDLDAHVSGGSDGQQG